MLSHQLVIFLISFFAISLGGSPDENTTLAESTPFSEPQTSVIDIREWENALQNKINETFASYKSGLRNLYDVSEKILHNSVGIFQFYVNKKLQSLDATFDPVKSNEVTGKLSNYTTELAGILDKISNISKEDAINFEADVFRFKNDLEYTTSDCMSSHESLDSFEVFSPNSTKQGIFEAFEHVSTAKARQPKSSQHMKNFETSFTENINWTISRCRTQLTESFEKIHQLFANAHNTVLEFVDDKFKSLKFVEDPIGSMETAQQLGVVVRIFSKILEIANKYINRLNKRLHNDINDLKVKFETYAYGCPETPKWVYYAKTSKCYTVTSKFEKYETIQSSGLQTSRDMDEADRKCELVTIYSHDENEFVKNLIANISTSAYPDKEDAGRAWIGLRKHETTYKWNDQNETMTCDEFVYSNLSYCQHDFATYGYMNTKGQWGFKPYVHYGSMWRYAQFPGVCQIKINRV